MRPRGCKSLLAKAVAGRRETSTTGLGHDLSVNFSAQFREQSDGFGRDLFLNKDIWLGKAYGLRSKLKWAPSDLTLRANLGYLHGRCRKFKDTPIYLQSPATCDPTPRRLAGPLTPGSTQCSFDASGFATVRSPTFSGNVSLDYTVARTNAGSLDWVANFFYTTNFSWNPSGQYPEPAYGLLNTSLTWTQSAGGYDLQLFCNNCTDKYHNAYIAESGPAIQRAGTEPRTFGFRLGMYF